MDREKYIIYINKLLNKMSDASLKRVFDYTQWRYVRDYDFDSNSEKECGSHE
ncbi:hypothetical protein [Thomasclavelia cocleata]|uniref:hypothetical protein n=1 Tax=Thomasclavelia cocleata TaxID=69824 RepID=UPI00262A6D6B|nr:hypothetical protein [Thomasclavelia cocleata]